MKKSFSKKFCHICHNRRESLYASHFPGGRCMRISATRICNTAISDFSATSPTRLYGFPT